MISTQPGELTMTELKHISEILEQDQLFITAVYKEDKDVIGVYKIKDIRSKDPDSVFIEGINGKNKRLSQTKTFWKNFQSLQSVKRK